MAENEKRTDKALIALCLEQDAEAWETLVRRYQRLIASITHTYALPMDDAADVLQNVFFRLFRQLPVLHQKEKLSSWIGIVTLRYCWKLKYKDEFDAPLTSLDDLPDDETEPADETRLTQDQMIILLERQHLLRDAVASLGSPCRKLLQELFYREEPLPYAELSRQLGIPVASIGPTRARCLGKLKDELKKNKFF